MSPKTKEAQAKVRAQSRTNILNAALKLFAEKGYHATSMDAISKQAQVSKGLIYNYFNTKEDLLKQIAEDAMTFGHEFIGDLDSQDPKIIFKNLIDLLFDMLENQTDHLRLIHSLSTQVWTFDFIQEIARNKTLMYDNFFRDLLVKLGFEGTPGEVTELEAVFEGTASMYFVMGDKKKLQVLKEHLIKKYCDANH